MITLPTTAVTDLLANVSTLISDFWPLIAVAVGVPLFFYIVSRLKGLVTGKGR